MSKNKIIELINFGTDDATSHEAMQDCFRSCIALSKCKTIVMRPTEKRCVLSSFNKCEEESTFFPVSEGKHVFPVSQYKCNFRSFYLLILLKNIYYH